MAGNSQIIAFVVSFFLVYFLVNFWIGRRGWQFLGRNIPFLNKKAYWSFYWLLVFSYFIGRMAGEYLPVKVSQYILLIGSFWLAYMVYFAIALALVDFFRVVNGRVRLFSSFEDSPSRQVAGSLLVILIVSGIIYFGWLNALNPVVTKYNVDIYKESGQLSKLKIVMVSDIHLGNVVHNGRLQKLVDMINEQKPDIVLLPGDIINENPDAFIEQNMNLSIREISTKYGIYAVPGNHDYIGGKSEEIFSYLQKTGVNMLRDRSVLVMNSFFLVGEDEKSHWANDEESKDWVSKVDFSYPVILMRHQPLKESEPFPPKDIDLILSGHSHRGQMFPFNLITERVFKIDWGYLREGNQQAIVSSGYGTWGPPVRIGNSPEIVVIELNFIKSKK